MEVSVIHGPANAAAKIGLKPGESFTAEAGAMIAMSGDMQIQTSTHKKGKRGIGKAIKRMFSGEFFFMNHFTAGPEGGEVWVSPTMPGDILEQSVEAGDELVIQGGSYLSSETSVNIDFSWQGMKSLFSGEGVFWLKASGSGKVLLNSYGAIYSVDVNDSYTVDTGHIVAYPSSLKFKITKAGGSWIHSFLGGEGLVMRFEGKGRIWCQSHNANSFGVRLSSFLRPVESQNA